VLHEIKASGLFLIKAYSSESKLAELDRKLKEANAKLSLQKVLESENQRLRSSLRFSGSIKYNLIASNVISRDSSNWNSVITIDSGEDKGVYSGLTVISDRGLVGKVIETTKNAAKVLLITSPQSNFGVVLPKDNIFGIAYGGNGTTLKLQYISESASIEVSDPVYISSSSNMYVQGVFVGKVSKVNKSIDDIFQKVEVSPATNFSGLGIVFVCKP
jgi:rod shape-determining protein MreC